MAKACDIGHRYEPEVYNICCLADYTRRDEKGKENDLKDVKCNGHVQQLLFGVFSKVLQREPTLVHDG